MSETRVGKKLAVAFKAAVRAAQALEDAMDVHYEVGGARRIAKIESMRDRADELAADLESAAWDHDVDPEE